jgi:hypothetical protein
MLVMPTCVVPLVPIGSSWDNLPSSDFYREYFFSLQWGLAAYWLEQTGNTLLLEGDVLDWMPFISEPRYSKQPFDIRGEIVNEAVQAVNYALRPEPSDPRLFYNASLFVFIIAPPPAGKGVDGGGYAHSIVMSPGDRFDFVAHEIGHHFGLQHSFDLASRRWDPGAQDGEYGNPFCVMSARTYGRDGGTDNKPGWVPSVSETNHYGPGLSVATRASRGWIPATDVNFPAVGQDLSITLSSAGDSAPVHPRAVRFATPRGETFVLSYRAPFDQYDTALSKAAVVLEQVEGGRAEIFYPGLNASTWHGAIRMPVDYGVRGSQLLGPRFTVELLDWIDGTGGNVSLRVRPGTQPPQPQLTATDPRELAAEIVDKGIASWAKGEMLCVEGHYPWALLHRRLEVELSLQLDTLDAPNVEWAVDGRALMNPSGVELFPAHLVRRYPPPPYGMITSNDVHVEYERPAPHRLLLRNLPQDGCYELDVACTVTNRLGSGTLRTTVVFEGQRLVMDPKFERDREACHAEQDVRDMHNRQIRRIVLPSDLWVPHDPGIRARVDRIIRLINTSSPRDVENLQSELSHALGMVGRPVQIEALPAITGRTKPQPFADASPPSKRLPPDSDILSDLGSSAKR